MKRLLLESSRSAALWPSVIQGKLTGIGLRPATSTASLLTYILTCCQAWTKTAQDLNAVIASAED